MQELEKRYEIARLIACELIGVLSGREAEDLEVWKNSSEKHARDIWKSGKDCFGILIIRIIWS